MSGAAEAKRLEAEREEANDEHEEAVPEYEAGGSSQVEQAPPPDYPASTIPFAEGDPSEIIQVPFVVSHEQNSLKRFLTGKSTVKQRVTTRPMKRGIYLEKYAKDSAGNFAGTGTPAPDAKMVFVAAMDKDAMKQAQVDTAFGKEHFYHWSSTGGGTAPWGA